MTEVTVCAFSYTAKERFRIGARLLRSALLRISAGKVHRNLGSSFDALGRVLNHWQVTANNSYSFVYGYNLAGDLTSEKYPSGRTVATCYDLAERVSQVGGNCQSLGLPAYATGTSASGGIQYAPQGAPSSYQYGNGVQRNFGFNGRLQLTSSVGQAGSQALLNMGWNWGTGNDNGNLQSASAQAGGLSFAQSYGYDKVNRLTSVNDSGYSRGFGYRRAGQSKNHCQRVGI